MTTETTNQGGNEMKLKWTHFVHLKQWKLNDWTSANSVAKNLAIITRVLATEDKCELWRVEKPKDAPPYHFLTLNAAKRHCLAVI